MKKLLSLVLAVVMVFGLVACGGNGSETKPTETTPPAVEAPTYTLNYYTEALGTVWNPHNWDTNGDNAILRYLETPLASMSILDSENGVYQWVYEAATYVKDVTAENQGDLTKYAVTLPEGQTAEQTTQGYVFEIGLNPDMKWENGTPINADTYIYSMKALLDPAMRNYRANLYYAGESAVAGGAAYYNSGAPIYTAMVAPYGEGETPDYSYDLAAGIEAGHVYINVTTGEMTLASYTLSELINSYNPDGAAFLKAVADKANPYGYTPVTAENLEDVKGLVAAALVPFGLDFASMDEQGQNELLMEALWVNAGEVADLADYDSTVGCYKVDDYTIRYVCQTALDLNYFLVSCSSNWLVYEDLYEGNKDTTGALVTTKYNSTKETTMSYGPYKIESLQEQKQLVLVQNENWFGFEKQEDGSLISYTNFEVDGEKRQQYKATKVVYDVMNSDAAKQAFLKGELDDWTPSADDTLAYATSERLYKVDETYTMSFFFNSNVEALKAMDESKGNTNSVVLSNENFRKAWSLAVDREQYVGATSGYKAAYSLMNNLYFYDVYNDPTSSYRNSDPAMQAICNLYGVEYGEGKAYATLRDAYLSINGYNLTEAKNLMATACTELVEAGLYTAGEPIVIRIGWAKGALGSADTQQVTLMQSYLNAAVEGSGFGPITLEAVGNIPDRYGDVPKGEYAVGYGAWGGAAFYPFRNFQVYCDVNQYDINELGCWDPSTEKLTLTVNGEEVTMTWMEWSGALIGTGPYANADFATKLQITADMEELFLKKFYRIPLCATTACFMLGYQVDYYTQDYNIMYDFGGFRLMDFAYTDAEWAEYVASQNGALSYE